MRALSHSGSLLKRIALFVLWGTARAARPLRFSMIGAPILAALALMWQPLALAQSVVVNSGTSVTFLDSGSSTGDFSSAFTPANFAAAQTGSAASITTPNGAYIASLPHGPNAAWIGTNNTAGIGVGDTALYAASFNVPNGVTSASLTIYYAVDNNLGYTNPGIYINGNALPNSTGLPASCINNVCAFNQEQTYSAANIAPLLATGTNWIYFDDVNLGGPAAIIFSAVINFTTSSAIATTSDPNIADFTSLVGTYALLSDYANVEGGCPAGSFTPTSAELATTGCRVYNGAQLSGLPANNNWVLATFPNSVSSIIVFPNIDHYGSAYDGYQYMIYGSNDGQSWTFLFDATGASPTPGSASGEPFVLTSFTGTPPTTVNNVLTPQSQPLPPGCSGTPNVLCSIGYIAQFTFGAPYKYYAFGASTLAVGNTDEELSAVGTTAQTFSTNGPTTTTFNNGEGTLVQQTIDASNAGKLTCNGTDGTVDCGGVQLSTTNTTLSNNPALPNAFSSYVVGTPWSSAKCAGRPGNGGTGDLCSLYVNACWGGNSGVAQAAASDFYCPFVNTTTNTTGFFVLKDTWDPLSPKPSIAPGTTVSLLDFVPQSAGETWSGSGPGAPNPVCKQVAPIGGNPGTAAQCDVKDTGIQIYNDQTTTRGTQPKKGWLISLFDVQMLLSTVQVFGGDGCPSPHSPLNDSNPADEGFENPNFAQNIWNNANCMLGFLVNPAQPPVPDNNNFVAAPPATLFYGPGAPDITPGGAPQGDTTITNTSASCLGVGLACNAQPWPSNPNDRKTLSSVFGGATDGTFELHWQAEDASGTKEKNAVLRASGDPCPNPEDPSHPVPPPCYYTNFFTTIVNLDSTYPTVFLAFSPAGGTYSVGQAGVSASFSCTDPVASNGAAASGIASCQASVDGGAATSTSPVPLKVGTAGSHKVTVTAMDNAGNKTSQDFPYTVLADADVAIFEQHTSDSVKPGGTLTYLAWALDLSKTNAAEVTVTEQLQLPVSGVQLGNVTATVAIVSCTLSGCSAMPPSGGANCTVSGTMITCNIGTLPSIYGLKGALIKTSIPVLMSSTPGAFFKITATATSPGDPNLKNNTTTDLLTVSSR